MSNKRLDYENDIILSKEDHFFALVNPYQGRSHLIIRSRTDIEPDHGNNLFDFDRPHKNEFWYIVQHVVAILQCPCLLCHHFGNFRSADHFHVHVVVKSKDFADFASKKMEGKETPKVIYDQIEKKCQFLIKKHFQYKEDELHLIETVKPVSDKLCETEWEDYYVEIHEYFPRINFIPKKPILYEKDPQRLLQQLQYLRESVFKAMVSFARYHNFTGYRTWQKLSGDVFNFNYERPPSSLIFGVLQPYSPELYAIHPNRDVWLENWKKCQDHPKNRLHFAFDPLSCV
ncbi:hypothetical protein TVAG_401970 [Trichomonas vaginalis G3]|uniref:HIT domain-containing protein n=1 Tax=Trichomonas vaginalis (strain ATCC PRA-98 / G3) TaxID=412133 RepID=A2DHV4_TRIV3|nr:HIT-like family [Trichomonas vaginalis G3]EAY19943.1 hypothetical protein TVAG_401970 [Trichomonas vaginalis G3]KAI5525893.1 HIT-like family [Trichomonas vaginalis G3]|eukprot:XP_001580929.1 hypothetical protein [Trichomonas vaginalis G3]